MQFDLDDAVQQFLPWDFSVTIGGVKYPTRPVTLGEMFAMSSLGADEGGLRSLILGFFACDDKPQIAQWTMDQVQALIAGIQEYAADRAKKNAPVVKRMMAESRSR